MADDLGDVLSPLLADAGLELVDTEVGTGVVRVTVDREGGVDLDALAAASQVVSAALGEVDPLVARYTLEVSSPGLERRLRSPAHFGRALGEIVSLRVRPGSGETRRVKGRLVDADDSSIELEGPDVPGGKCRVAYDSVERARTVFEWGASPAPSPSRGHKRTRRRKVGETAREDSEVRPTATDDGEDGEPSPSRRSAGATTTTERATTP